MYLRVKEFVNSKPILFGQNMVRTPYGVTITEADIVADALGKKSVPEGSFIVGVGSATRFLPRAKSKNAVATNSPTVTVTAPSMHFKVGDVLYNVAGYAEVTFGGTIASGDVFTLEIAGVNYSFTSGSNTAAAIAAGQVTDNAAALLAAGVTITQKASTGTLIIRANDSYTINTYCSSGAATATVNTTEAGYLGDMVLPLGTILSIGSVNAAGERAITLAANAAYALPAGSNIGVKVNKYLGIYPYNLDLSEEPMAHLAPICEADGVYEQNLPYIDLQLKRRFSDLRIDKRFYRAI
jgi:hypothetical protein